MPERLAITRYDIPATILNPRNYEVGVEVGVEHGYFSYYLLQHSDLRLHSVDLWSGKWSGLLEDARSLLSEFGRRSVLHHMSSIAAASRFREQVDFVYLDADHRYKAVAADIQAWWPLVKQGGVLAGHDYCAAGAGVMRAVDEFVEREGLTLELTREAWSTWIVEKL